LQRAHKARRRNKAFDGSAYCHLHKKENADLGCGGDGFNPFSTPVSTKELPKKVTLALRELKVLIRRRSYEFDDGHIELLDEVREELRLAIENGTADESALLIILQDLQACACNKAALAKFLRSERESGGGAYDEDDDDEEEEEEEEESLSVRGADDDSALIWPEPS